MKVYERAADAFDDKHDCRECSRFHVADAFCAGARWAIEHLRSESSKPEQIGGWEAVFYDASATFLDREEQNETA